MAIPYHAFNGSIILYNVCNRRHSDIIIMRLTAVQFCTKHLSQIFHILKINRMMASCNLRYLWDGRHRLFRI